MTSLLPASFFDHVRVAEKHLDDALAVLSHMRVTTEPMRPDEMSEIEQRRVTASGYIDAALDCIEAAFAAQRREDVRRSSPHRDRRG